MRKAWQSQGGLEKSDHTEHIYISLQGSSNDSDVLTNKQGPHKP